VYRGHSFVGAQTKTRGAASAYYPKRSFTLKFTKEDKFNEPGFAGGFNDKRKVTLTTTFDDNSYLRQRLAFELWNRLDPTHIKVQSYNAVVFLNGAYHGLYTVSDHIDGYLMEDFGLNQDGDLYKARSHEANFRLYENGTTVLKASAYDGYSKEEGTPEEGEEGAFDNLVELLTWVETSTPEAFAAEIDTRMARREYEDWWIFVSFIMADDSSGKNSYHYRDPTMAGSLWHFVPWDLNESFGQDWRTYRLAANASTPEGYYVSMNGLFEKLLSSTTLGPALRARYGATLAGVYAPDNLIALLDGLVPEVDESARRDEAKWQDAYHSYVGGDISWGAGWSTRTDFTTYEEEVEYVRTWIRARHAFLERIY
jgi:spore coat protein H